ncbi:MAG TPA: cobalt ECF transporter T component CbiQ [Polyangiaceae bacterium]|jgi:cobalt/nickel transport system permease protein
MSGTHLLRSYAEGDSPIHRASAGGKLLVTLGLVVGLALVPVAWAAWTGLALALVLGLVVVSRVPLSVFLARLALVQPFVLGVAVLALFQGRGVSVFVALALKSTTCVAAVQLLAATTPFTDVLDALRRARLPRSFLQVLALLHRYLFVLLDESRRMRRARAARTWNRSRWAAWQNLSSVVATSFVRSVSRAERIAIAMRARGGS